MIELGGYLVHPAAALFPMMGEDELKGLADDIKANGLIDPVKLNYDESILIDGRNRLCACEIAGAETGTDYLITAALPEMTEEETLSYITSSNVHRRHLTVGQVSSVAADLEPMFAEAAKERERLRKSKGGVTIADSRHTTKRERQSAERAAKAVGASGKSVSDVKALRRDAPDLAAKVADGSMTINAAKVELKKRKEQGPPKPPKPTLGDNPALLADIRNRIETGAPPNYGELAKKYGISNGTINSAYSRVKGQIEKEGETIDLDTLSGPMREKVERIRKQIYRELEADFNRRVDREVGEILKPRIALMDKGFAEYRRILDSRKGIMTKDDFDTIRSCLHPDSRLSVSDKKLEAAFRIFNELEILFLNEKDSPTTRIPSSSADLRRKSSRG